MKINRLHLLVDVRNIVDGDEQPTSSQQADLDDQSLSVQCIHYADLATARKYAASDAQPQERANSLA